MGRAVEEITEPMRGFIEQQPVFFVATAPLADVGRIRLSPKGYDSFRVLDSRRVAYLDRYWAEKNATSIDGLPALS